MILADADIHLCYHDLWMTNKAYYGIHSGNGGNTAEIRLGAGDTVAATQPDASIAAAFNNRISRSLQTTAHSTMHGSPTG